jgi:uncharacterized protein (UPF0276 family)
MSFFDRVRALPVLGVGVSTEYGAADAPSALDPLALHEALPLLCAFLEVGVETAKGLDPGALAWAARKLPTTYHFLDVNLDDPDDMDERWLEEVAALVAVLRPAWLCGDAGLWHLGRRDRDHMLLLPPVLSPRSADATAAGIAYLRSRTGLEVLPENPPGVAFVGPMDLLDYYARLCERADTGMLLDCAHLAIYQRLRGRSPTAGLDGFPLERIVELHVAGGRTVHTDGFAWVDDDHSPEVLDDTWQIFDHIIDRAPNLKAVIVECERNTIEAVGPLFRRVAGAFFHDRSRRPGLSPIAPSWEPAEPAPRPKGPGLFETPDGRVQTTIARLLYDPRLVDDLHEGRPLEAAGQPPLTEDERSWLLAIDRRAWSADRYRRARTLTGLVPEFPVSVLLRGVPGLEAFFDSPELHACIAGGGSLALTFGAWLRPAAGPFAELELALARARRPRGASGPGQIALAEGAALCSLPGDIPLHYARLRDSLGPDPLANLVQRDGPAPRPSLVEPPTWIIIETDSTGRPSIGDGNEAIGRLLEGALEPVPRDALLALARALGAEPPEDEEIVNDLVADGLLTLGR